MLSFENLSKEFGGCLLNFCYVYYIFLYVIGGWFFFFPGSTHVILAIGAKNREGGRILRFFFPSGRKKKPSENPKKSSNSKISLFSINLGFQISV